MHQLIKAASSIPEEQAKIPPAFPGPEVLLKTDFAETSQVTLALFMVLLTTFLALLLKQNKYLRTVTQLIPESGMMLFFGVIVALIMAGIDSFVVELQTNAIRLPHTIIQHVLIAPIILHASYELYHPHFFGQIGTILIMAFVATILNTIIIGLSLRYIFGSLFPSMNIFHCMTFAPIIAAVDPVAVLAVFEVVHADKALYFLVFGEALLNDGVTFVLFEGIKELAPIPEEELSSVPIVSYVYVLLSFLTAPLGGGIIGFVVGLASALVTKHTSEATAFLKPMLVLLFAALAYGLTIVFGFSNILGLIAYGLTQERYAFGNMTVKASILTSNIVHTVAIIFETILFFILGCEFAAVGFYAVWDFALAVIITIIISRIIVTCGLCAIINRYTERPINWRWQTLIIVGGLRGAIAFAMVVTYEGPFHKLFYDTTLVVIFFTTIANGIITKPLVTYLGLKEEVGVQTDYGLYYGYDHYEPGCIARGWGWLEDKFICRLFTKENAVHNALVKEILADEEKEAFKELQKDRIHN